jgi:hypothetical protein
LIYERLEQFSDAHYPELKGEEVVPANMFADLERYSKGKFNVAEFDQKLRFGSFST